jgi:hypothetical protein
MPVLYNPYELRMVSFTTGWLPDRWPKVWINQAISKNGLSRNTIRPRRSRDRR